MKLDQRISAEQFDDCSGVTVIMNGRMIYLVCKHYLDLKDHSQLPLFNATLATKNLHFKWKKNLSFLIEVQHQTDTNQITGMDKNHESVQAQVNTHLLLKPAHGLLFADAVPETDAACLPLLISDAETRSAQNLHTREVNMSGFSNMEERFFFFFY